MTIPIGLRINFFFESTPNDNRSCLLFSISKKHLPPGLYFFVCYLSSQNFSFLFNSENERKLGSKRNKKNKFDNFRSNVTNIRCLLSPVMLLLTIWKIVDIEFHFIRPQHSQTHPRVGTRNENTMFLNKPKTNLYLMQCNQKIEWFWFNPQINLIN